MRFNRRRRKLYTRLAKVSFAVVFRKRVSREIILCKWNPFSGLNYARLIGEFVKIKQSKKDLQQLLQMAAIRKTSTIAD